MSEKPLALGRSASGPINGKVGAAARMIVSEMERADFLRKVLSSVIYSSPIRFPAHIKDTSEYISQWSSPGSFEII